MLTVCRFSSFVKTGTETYVLGRVSLKAPISETEKVKIVLSPERKPLTIRLALRRCGFNVSLVCCLA